MKFYYQFIYILAAVLSIPFFPVLLILAAIAKKRTGKLPDARVPSGKFSGTNPGFKLAVLGESTVAGVGVENHTDGVTCQIARYLNSGTEKEVIWEAIGATGFTARRIHNKLASDIPVRMKEPDILVILLGGNDTFELNSPLHWRKNMLRLVIGLRTDFPNTMIVIANLPPVHSFTSFSTILQWYLGSLTNLHRKVLIDFPELFDNLIYMSENIDFDKWRKEEGRDVPIEEFFSDGVHPSALTYKLWGKQIAERIMNKKKDDTQIKMPSKI